MTADATLLSAPDSPSIVAKTVDYNLRAGVPYEVSPLIDLEGAVAEEIVEGASAVVNGREVVGPLTIYTNATIRGVAICPHGTDARTSAFIAFKARKNKEIPKMEEKDNLVDLNLKKLDEPAGDDPTPASDTPSAEVDPTPTPEPAPNGGLRKRKIDKELAALVDEFGRESGVDYYFRGYTLEEARAEDYAALKKLRDDIAKKESEEPAAPEVAPEEEKKEDEVAKALAAKIAKLESRLVALSALVRRGDDAGVSDVSAPAKAEKKDPVALAAARLAALGTVRRF